MEMKVVIDGIGIAVPKTGFGLNILSGSYIKLRDSKKSSIILMGMGIIGLKLSREAYVQISNQIYSANNPLMDSVVLDFLMQKEMSIVIVIIITWILVIEIKIKPIHRRLRLNFMSFIGLTAYTGLLIYLIYSPVINAN